MVPYGGTSERIVNPQRNSKWRSRETRSDAEKVLMISHRKIRGGAVMPIIQIDMLEGRTVEQKRNLVQKVTEVVCETANCPAEAVTIVIRDMPFENLGKAGKLRIDG